MGNCSSSRRKIPLPHKPGISTAIKNVVIEDVAEEKQLRRSFSRGSILLNPNANINNFNLTNNDKEKKEFINQQNIIKDFNNNKPFKSKSKSKEKIINDFGIKNYYPNSVIIQGNNDLNSNNTKSKNIFAKTRLSTNSLNIDVNDKYEDLKISMPNNITKKSVKCKVKNKIPIPTSHYSIINISDKKPIQSQKYKISRYNSNSFTYQSKINNENINLLNNSPINSFNENDNSKNNNINNKNISSYKCIKSIEGHKEKIVSMIELSDGSIATGSYDSKIKIWNLESLQCIRTIQEEGNIFCLLEMEPNIILSGTNQNTIQLFDLNYDDNNIFKFSFKGHDLWVNCLIKCSEYYFASGSNDADIKVWDYKNKTIYRTLRGHKDCILAMILLKNKKICSGSADLTLRIWDWGLGVCEFFFSGHQKWIKCLCQLDKDDVIISGADDMKIKIWKNIGYKNKRNIINNWKVIKEYTGHTHSVRTLCKINEDTFASGSFDGSIKIWNLNENEAIQSLEGHKSYVISVIKIKNGDLVSCSNDHTIKIWRKYIDLDKNYE